MIENPSDSKLLVKADGHGVFADGYLFWRDGTRLLAQPFDPETWTLSGDPQELVAPLAAGELNDPSLTVSASRLVYDAGGEDKQLAWYSSAGLPLGLFGAPGSYAGFRLFDNGRKVAVQANARQDIGLWIVDEGGRSIPVYRSLAWGPAPSPDARWVIFGTASKGVNSLYRTDTSGATQHPLEKTIGDTLRFSSDWSGDEVLYLVAEKETQTTKNDIWSVRVSPDGEPVPGAAPEFYLGTPGMEMGPRFAPGQNQRWVAYHSDVSSRNEVYLYSRASGVKLPISTQGGSWPVWRKDGQELFYVSPDNKIMVVQVTYGPTSATASVPRKLFPLPPNVTVGFNSPFDTIDGQKFLVLSGVAPAIRPLRVINNWRAKLKR